MALKSEQSRALRHKMLWRTLLAYVIYTIAFALFALLFSKYISPQIGNLIADASSQWVLFTDAKYKALDDAELLSEFIARTSANNETWHVLYQEEDEDEISLNISSQEKNYEIEVLDVSNNQEEVESIGVATDTPYDEIVLGTLLYTNNNSGDIMLVPYSRQYLADELLYRDLPSSSAWQKGSDMYSDENGYVVHSFYARDLSVYKTIKELKWPTLILLYIIGTFAIMFISLWRMSKHFDELSEGIASVFKDRTKPVKLPPSLSIAQGELNNIRLQALSDEHAAQAAEIRKNELVVYMAHDIRTPLTSMIGYLSLLNEAPELPEETRQKYIATTQRKAEHLEQLVEEFFEITKYNLQAIPIERSAVDLHLFFEQLVDEFYPQSSSKGLKICLDAPTNRTFFVDSDKLARALGNIIRNAISYADPNTTISINVKEALSPNTHVNVNDQQTGKDHRNSFWEICISDKGREIADIHLESIFDKFYREDSSRSTSKGGSGLGLAIAKEIIVSHGGEIFASSNTGITTFTIRIPKVD